MKQITQDEINEMLKQHELWLHDKESGLRADFHCANLEGANLDGTNLTKANLAGANLVGANLVRARGAYAEFYRANLIHARFTNAVLRHTDFRFANLSCACLKNANFAYSNFNWANLGATSLCDANLSDADFKNANLTYAEFCRVTLTGANFHEANPIGAVISDAEGIEKDFANILPEGSLYGYKKSAEGHIVKLLIPEDAKRSNGTSRKCRCSKALVVSITNSDGEEVKTATSWHDPYFIYEVGKTVEAKDFNEDRWKECTSGIHFFLTEDEAKRH